MSVSSSHPHYAQLSAERDALIQGRDQARAERPAAEAAAAQTAAALAAARQAMLAAEQAVGPSLYAWATPDERQARADAEQAVAAARKHLADAEATHQAANRAVVQLGVTATQAQQRLNYLNTAVFADRPAWP